jgi:hypothetical protein
LIFISNFSLLTFFIISLIPSYATLLPSLCIKKVKLSAPVAIA